MPALEHAVDALCGSPDSALIIGSLVDAARNGCRLHLTARHGTATGRHAIRLEQCLTQTSTQVPPGFQPRLTRWRLTHPLPFAAGHSLAIISSVSVRAPRPRLPIGKFGAKSLDVFGAKGHRATPHRAVGRVGEPNDGDAPSDASSSWTSEANSRPSASSGGTDTLHDRRLSPRVRYFSCADYAAAANKTRPVDHQSSRHRGSCVTSTG